MKTNSFQCWTLSCMCHIVSLKHKLFTVLVVVKSINVCHCHCHLSYISAYSTAI